MSGISDPGQHQIQPENINQSQAIPLKTVLHDGRIFLVTFLIFRSVVTETIVDILQVFGNADLYIIVLGYIECFLERFDGILEGSLKLHHDSIILGLVKLCGSFFLKFESLVVIQYADTNKTELVVRVDFI